MYPTITTGYNLRTLTGRICRISTCQRIVLNNKEARYRATAGARYMYSAPARASTIRPRSTVMRNRTRKTTLIAAPIHIFLASIKRCSLG